MLAYRYWDSADGSIAGDWLRKHKPSLNWKPGEAGVLFCGEWAKSRHSFFLLNGKFNHIPKWRERASLYPSPCFSSDQLSCFVSSVYISTQLGPPVILKLSYIIHISEKTGFLKHNHDTITPPKSSDSLISSYSVFTFYQLSYIFNSLN